MNILLLNWRDPFNPKSGGAEIVTMEHAKGWTRNGHHVVWVTSLYSGARAHEIIDGIKFVRLGSPITINLFGLLYVLQNAKKFDVIVDEIHGLPFFTPTNPVTKNDVTNMR